MGRVSGVLPTLVAVDALLKMLSSCPVYVRCGVPCVVEEVLFEFSQHA